MNAGLAVTTYATLLYLGPGVGYALTMLALGNPAEAAVALGTAVGALVFALILFAIIRLRIRPRVGGVRVR